MREAKRLPGRLHIALRRWREQPDLRARIGVQAFAPAGPIIGSRSCGGAVIVRPAVSFSGTRSCVRTALGGKRMPSLFCHFLLACAVYLTDTANLTRSCSAESNTPCPRAASPTPPNPRPGWPGTLGWYELLTAMRPSPLRTTRQRHSTTKAINSAASAYNTLHPSGKSRYASPASRSLIVGQTPAAARAARVVLLTQGRHSRSDGSRACGAGALLACARIAGRW